MVASLAPHPLDGSAVLSNAGVYKDLNYIHIRGYPGDGAYVLFLCHVFYPLFGPGSYPTLIFQGCLSQPSLTTVIERPTKCPISTSLRVKGLVSRKDPPSCGTQHKKVVDRIAKRRLATCVDLLPICQSKIRTTLSSTSGIKRAPSALMVHPGPAVDSPLAYHRDVEAHWSAATRVATAVRSASSKVDLVIISVTKLTVKITCPQQLVPSCC